MADGARWGNPWQVGAGLIEVDAIRARARRVIRELEVRLVVLPELPVEDDLHVESDGGEPRLVHEVVVRGFIALRSHSAVLRWQRRRRFPASLLHAGDGTAQVVSEHPRRA